MSGMRSIWFLLLAVAIADAAPERLRFSLKTDPAAPHGRIVLIIPGLGQTTSDPGYHAVGGYYAARGITPVFIDIDWWGAGLGDLATTAAGIEAEVKTTYRDARVCLFGFSFGAALAYELSRSLHPSDALLCSLSPVFAEDRPDQRFVVRLFLQCAGRFAFDRLSYAHDEGKGLTFLYGDHDSVLITPSLIEHRKTALPRSKVVMVPEACHALGPAYLRAIAAAVREIPRP